MLSVEDIRNVQFTKSLGGYKTAEVDDFLDQCEDTVAALLAEKADLTAKMTVLADKLVEYRKDEDSLRTALFDAHKMAEQIERDAREKAEAMLAEAEQATKKALAEAGNASERAMEEARASIAAENAELKRAQEEVATFKAHVLRLYREQVMSIETLPGEIKPQPVEVPAPAPVVPVVVPVAEPPAPAVVEPVAEVEETEQPPANNRYADLKFGESYDLAEDIAEEDGKGRFKRKK